MREIPPAQEYATAHAELTEALDLARRRLATANQACERVVAARHPYADDMATVSGIRRQPNARADRLRDSKNRRESSAWLTQSHAEHLVERLERAMADLETREPRPYTREQLEAARAVRDRRGSWHRVVRVNAKTVSVETGYSWVDRIKINDIWEVLA